MLMLLIYVPLIMIACYGAEFTIRALHYFWKLSKENTANNTPPAKRAGVEGVPDGFYSEYDKRYMPKN